MTSSFTRFLDHTQRRTTVGRTPLDEWSARRTDLCLTTHNTNNRQTFMPRGGIRTHDLSRRVAADLCLRRRGWRDRRLSFYWTEISRKQLQYCRPRCLLVLQHTHRMIHRRLQMGVLDGRCTQNLPGRFWIPKISYTPVRKARPRRGRISRNAQKTPHDLQNSNTEFRLNRKTNVGKDR